MSDRIFRHSDGLIPNLLALSYALNGYVVGMWLMATTGLVVALLATLWFAHALVIAAYLFHEFAHDTIFARHETNSRGGVLMTWLNRYRVKRVLSDDFGVVDTAAGKADGFIGAMSVSFLTAV